MYRSSKIRLFVLTALISLCFFPSRDALQVSVVATLSLWLRPFWRQMGRNDIFLVSGDGELADKVSNSQIRRTEGTQEGCAFLLWSNLRRFHLSEHLEYS